MNNDELGANDPKKRPNRLTKTAQRLATFKTWYNEGAKTLMEQLPNHGVNAPDLVIDRASKANNSSGADRIYLQTLSDALRLNKSIAPADVVTMVTTVRHRCGMPAITDKMYQKCLAELQKVAVLKAKIVEVNGEMRKHPVAIFKLLV